MSTNSRLRAAFAPPGHRPDVTPVRSSSDGTCPILLRLDGPLERPIDALTCLKTIGVSLKSAHSVINRLAEHQAAVCQIRVETDLAALARALSPMNISVHRRRTIDHPAAFITDLRARHELSQRELADALGLDTRTLQNWEQGRNRPDAAALLLMQVFDRSPDLVRQVVFAASERPAA